MWEKLVMAYCQELSWNIQGGTEERGHVIFFAEVKEIDLNIV
jgi:hypothetical protein